MRFVHQPAPQSVWNNGRVKVHPNHANTAIPRSANGASGDERDCRGVRRSIPVCRHSHRLSSGQQYIPRCFEGPLLVSYEYQARGPEKYRPDPCLSLLPSIYVRRFESSRSDTRRLFSQKASTDQLRSSLQRPPTEFHCGVSSSRSKGLRALAAKSSSQHRDIPRLSCFERPNQRSLLCKVFSHIKGRGQRSTRVVLWRDSLEAHAKRLKTTLHSLGLVHNLKQSLEGPNTSMDLVIYYFLWKKWYRIPLTCYLRRFP